MKKYLLAIIPLMLSLALFGCSGTTEETAEEPNSGSSSNASTPADNSMTGNVSEISFTYDVQDSWGKEQYTDATIGYFLDGSSEPGYGAPEIIVDESYADKAIQDFDSQVAFLKETYFGDAMGMSFGEPVESKVGENACLTAEFTDDTGNKGKLMMFFVTAETIGMVEYVADAADYETYIADVDKTMKSVAV